MTPQFTLPPEQRLTVLFRVEPGCLGPEGMNYIEEFCHFANKAFNLKKSGVVIWQIVPRYDKKLPEMQFSVANKTLTYDKASKYLALYNQNLDQFEQFIDERLTFLIDQYFQR